MSVMQSAPGPYTVIDGRRCLYFAGTSYLGLHGHPQVVEAACAAVKQFGVHTATSRSGFGDSPPVLEMEAKAAAFLGKEAAWCFVSGYLGATVLAAALASEFDAVFIDEHAHYSVFDAAKLIDGPVIPFKHADADDLHTKLKSHLRWRQKPLVMTDGVFAMLGDVAPVAAICEVLAEYEGAGLLVDDAHGLGLLGASGRGTFEHAGLHDAVNRATATQDAGGVRLLQCATLSKAMGGYGGVVAGDAAFIDALRRGGTIYRGASAPPAPVAAASSAAIDVINDDPSIRNRLRANSDALRTGLRGLGFDVPEAPTPIICLQLDDPVAMQRLQQSLLQRDIAIAYSAKYSGLGPAGGLRIAACAGHTGEMIEQLLTEMKEAM